MHSHQCDIDTLIRLSNVQNVLLTTNPTSAHALCYVLEMALREGRKDMIPSFFNSLESPGVKDYNKKQEKSWGTKYNKLRKEWNIPQSDYCFPSFSMYRFSNDQTFIILVIWFDRAYVRTLFISLWIYLCVLFSIQTSLNNAHKISCAWCTFSNGTLVKCNLMNLKCCLCLWSIIFQNFSKDHLRITIP